MFDFLHKLNTERFNYWIALIGMVISFSGLFAMRLRLQQIPERGRWLDTPYVCAAIFFLFGTAICIDFLLELFGLYTLSPLRTVLEHALSFTIP